MSLYLLSSITLAKGTAEKILEMLAVYYLSIVSLKSVGEAVSKDQYLVSSLNYRSLLFGILDD